MNTTQAPISAVDAAHARRSIRNYSPQPVSEKTISALLTAAGKAPSAWNIQPWKVHVIRNQELKNKLQQAAYSQSQVGSSQVLLVITSDMQSSLANLESRFAYLGQEKAASQADSVRSVFAKMNTDAQENWARSQANIFLGYLLLVASSLGLGTSPMLGFDAERVKEILGLAQNVQIPALVAVGWPAEEGFVSSRIEFSELAQHWN